MQFLVVAVTLIISCVLAGPWFHEKRPLRGEVVIYNLTEVDRLFQVFKRDYNKQYPSNHEENIRRAIFEANLKLIHTHNTQYEMGQKSYFLAVNQFTDVTNKEYRQFNRLNMLDRNRTRGSTFLSPSNVQLPDTVDWRQKGYVTGVKNQGSCGSCWAFSTTGSLEGQHFRKTGQLIPLSEQQLVDCSIVNHGCNGGLMDDAFDYIRSMGGLESEIDYPYTAKDGICQFKPSLAKATCTGYMDVTEGSEEDLQAAVATVGPVSVAIDASHSSFQMYSGGIYNEPFCSSSSLDHGVLVVGYGTSGSQDYWLVKNSWGESWGEEGYIRMSRFQENQCGIASEASYPLVK